MVTRMESQGLVARKGSDRDSRRSHVFLTDSGGELAARIDVAWAHTERTAFERLTPKETKRLKKLLKKIRVSLEGDGKQARPA